MIILTSSDQVGDAARSREVGVAAYLTKPVGQWELLDALHRALAGAEPALPARPTPAHAPPSAGPRLRVLVAEVNEFNQRLVVRLLEKRGHAVTLAADGPAALAALGGGRFDLALLDLQMPGKDGLQVAAEWRRREGPTGRRLPLVAVTAHALAGDRERCLAAGMDGYLAKPLRAAELDAELARVTAPTVGLLDRPTLLAACGGDQGLLDELLALFADRAPLLMADLRQAVAGGEATAAGRIAHVLKGMAAAFSAPAGEAAERVEQSADAGDLIDAGVQVRLLANLIDRLLPVTRGLTIADLVPPALPSAPNAEIS